MNERRRTRNDQPFSYCLYDPSVQYAVLDEYGNETGEIIPCYESAVDFEANISPAIGQNQTEMFGGFDTYDKVIVTCDMSCPINENTVLFLDKEPEYTTVSTHRIATANGQTSITTTEYSLPAYDYIVKRVAKSLHSIAIAIRKVDVG